MKLATAIVSTALASSLLLGLEPKYIQGFTFMVPSKEFGSYKEEVMKQLKSNGYIGCNTVTRNTVGEIKKLNILCTSKNKQELLKIYNFLQSNAKYPLSKGQMSSTDPENN